jgi:hypothetical protein
MPTIEKRQQRALAARVDTQLHWNRGVCEVCGPGAQVIRRRADQLQVRCQTCDLFIRNMPRREFGYRRRHGVWEQYSPEAV